MKNLFTLAFICLQVIVIKAQEESNCNPDITGMSFNSFCVETEGEMQVDIGWAISTGEKIGECSAPSGSWQIVVELANTGDYTYQSATFSDGSDWEVVYSLGNNTVTFTSNQEYVSQPPSSKNNYSANSDNGTISILVKGVEDTNECNQIVSSAEVVVSDSSPESFSNNRSADQKESALGVSSTALPVELASFDVKKNNVDALLNWVTVTEENTDFFEIQRSFDGVNFEAIDRVESAGFSVVTKKYDFVDEGIGEFATEVFYKLRIVDFDGYFEYSQIRYVQFSNLEEGINVFPNPANNSEPIVVTGKNLQTIHVFSATGQLVKTIELNNDTSSVINTFDLPAGIYLLKINNNVTKKVIVNK